MSNCYSSPSLTMPVLGALFLLLTKPVFCTGSSVTPGFLCRKFCGKDFSTPVYYVCVWSKSCLYLHRDPKSLKCSRKEGHSKVIGRQAIVRHSDEPKGQHLLSKGRRRRLGSWCRGSGVGWRRRWRRRWGLSTTGGAWSRAVRAGAPCARPGMSMTSLDPIPYSFLEWRDWFKKESRLF